MELLMELLMVLLMVLMAWLAVLKRMWLRLPDTAGVQ